MSANCLLPCNIENDDGSEIADDDTQDEVENKICLNFALGAKNIESRKKNKEFMKYLQGQDEIWRILRKEEDDSNNKKMEETRAKSFLDDQDGVGTEHNLSQDFWFTKLNNFKSQGLDLVALRAKDLKKGSSSSSFLLLDRDDKVTVDDGETPEDIDRMLREFEEIIQTSTADDQNFYETPMRNKNVYKNLNTYREKS